MTALARASRFVLLPVTKLHKDYDCKDSIRKKSLVLTKEIGGKPTAVKQIWLWLSKDIRFISLEIITDYLGSTINSCFLRTIFGCVEWRARWTEGRIVASKRHIWLKIHRLRQGKIWVFLTKRPLRTRNWQIFILAGLKHPDLAPPDYYLFPNLKERWFSSSEEAAPAARDWFAAQQKNCSLMG
jgi:hypothetical protein